MLALTIFLHTKGNAIHGKKYGRSLLNGRLSHNENRIDRRDQTRSNEGRRNQLARRTRSECEGFNLEIILFALVSYRYDLLLFRVVVGVFFSMSYPSVHLASPLKATVQSISLFRSLAVAERARRDGIFLSWKVP